MLKNTLFTLCLLFVGNLVSAQTAAAPAADPIMENVDKLATFPGGEAAIQKFVAENQRPLSTKQSEVSSTEVVLRVVVEKDGRISGMKSVTAPNVQLEEEAVVLLKKMGKWSPAHHNGQAVRSYATVSMRLKLD